MPRQRLLKAYEIKDLNVEFASVVDYGANLKGWAMVKNKSGGETHSRGFETKAPLLKNEWGVPELAGYHIAIGPLLEPFAEDAHGDFQTADEIAIAFQKSEAKIDTMHNEVEVPEDTAKLAKEWLLEEDWKGTNASGEEMELKKGTWMTAMYVKEESELAKGILDGSLNGLSAGGTLTRVYEDVSVEEVEQNALAKFKEGMLKFLGFKKEDLEKGLFNEKISAVEDNRVDDAMKAYWIYDDIWWDEKWDKSFDGMVLATQEFLDHLKTLTIDGQNTLVKRISENRGGTMKKEEIQGLIDEATGGLVTKIDSLEKQLGDSQEKLKKKELNEERKEILEKVKENGIELEKIEEVSNTDLMKQVILKKNKEISLDGTTDVEIKAMYKMVKDIKTEYLIKAQSNGATVEETAEAKELRKYMGEHK